MSTELVANDVEIVYGHGRNRLQAVKGVSVTITPERSVGIAGESGSGKSTLARALVGMLTPVSGTVTFNGTPILDMPARGPGSRARAVQMVFQDPMSSLNPRMTAGEAIREALMVNDIPGDHRVETIRLLGTVGMDQSAVEKYPFQFSGGQRQRIALARAMAVRPDVLVCDEMTSALDVSVQAAVLNLLRDIRAETGLGLCVVTHNLDVLRYLCDDIVIMKSGEVVESGAAETLFTDPQQDYTRMLIAAVPRFAVTPGIDRSAA